MSEIDKNVEHISDETCWCCPYLEYEDPETGDQVWVHRDRSEAN